MLVENVKENLKEFFKKVDLEKDQQMTKSRKNIPRTRDFLIRNLCLNMKCRE